MATSVTGSGVGEAGFLTNKQLSNLVQKLNILTGRVQVDLIENLSPPANWGTVTFDTPLPGSASNYVVLLTPINGTTAYVVEFSENDNHDFTGFVVGSDNECEICYLVAKISK